MYRDINRYLRPSDYPVQRLGKERQIEIILQETDFDKIHRAMVVLDWQWAYSPTGVPTIEEMKSQAKHYLEEVWNIPEDGISEVYFTGSGGFMAYKYVIDGLKILSLKFELAGWEFDYDSVQSENYD